ncbi:MAG: SRPBCC family protein [Acidobacteria bacterium]|nr:SRPBCC family protein [Acidobacteriota bacterium]
MHAVRAELPVDLDLTAAWRRLRDLSAPHLYVPGLTGAAFTGPQRVGVGTRRRVRATRLLTLDETVTEWREAAGLTIRLHRGDRGPPPPFRTFLFEYGLVDRGGRTWLVNRARYSLRPVPWGARLDRALLRPLIARLLRDITLAQKIHYETGQRVTAAGLRAWKRGKRPSRASKGS